MTTFQPLGEGVYRVTGAMPRSAVTGRFITNQDDPLTPDERAAKALNDLCGLDDEFGLEPADVRWVREQAQIVRTRLEATEARARLAEASAKSAGLALGNALAEAARLRGAGLHAAAMDAYRRGDTVTISEDDLLLAPAGREHLPTLPDRESVEQALSEHAQVFDDPNAVAKCSCGAVGLVSYRSEAGVWHQRHQAAAVLALFEGGTDRG